MPLDKSTLIAAAEQIRRATQNGENTAERVGKMFCDIIDALFGGIGSDQYLSRTRSDRSIGQVSSDKGFEVGQYNPGTSGAVVQMKEDGRTYAEVDELWVRVRAVFESLLVMESKVVGGRLYVTPGCGIRCSRVETLDDRYRCWFLAEQDGELSECRMEADDLARCERFSATQGENGRVESRYYWRRVLAVSNTGETDAAGNRYGYIDLSITDCDSGSAVPAAGDEICHFGNVSADPANDYRKTAIMISAVGPNAPCIQAYCDICGYSLAGTELATIERRPSDGKIHVRFGRPSDSSFLDYMQDNGLELAGKVHLSSTVGDGGTTIGQTLVKTDVLFISVAGDDTPSLPSLAEDGSIADSKGWTTDAPAWVKGNCIWQCVYERRADSSARIVGPTNLSGTDGRGISRIEEQYYLSSSRTELVGGAWMPSPPAWVSGHYYWTRLVVTYTDGSFEYKDPVCVSGEQGEAGSGAYRIDLDNESAMIACDPEGNVTGTYPTSRVSVWRGTTELTISNGGVTEYSLLSSGISASWADYNAGRLSTRSMTSDTATVKVTATLSDGNTLVATMHIAKVRPGKNGSSVTVASSSVTYQVSTDGTTPPQGTWENDIPDVPNGSFLWTKTVVTYSDGTSTTSYGVSRCGADGDSVTIRSKDVLYCVGNYPTQPADYLFTLASLNGITFDQGTYLWSKTVVTYSDGTEIRSYSVSRIGMDGTDGIGKPGEDGKTSYVHLAYCSSISGSLPHPRGVSGFSTTAFAGARYIGLCTDYTEADPATHSSYEWSEYRGEDGKPGDDAVLYEIVPSSSQVTRNAEGELSAEAVGCSVYKTAGALRSLSDDHLVRYRLLPDGAWKSAPNTPLEGVYADIAVTSGTSAICFELYDTVDGEEIIYDRETVPVLVDAAGFVGGDNILKGTNQGVKGWSAYTYAGGNTVSPMLLSSMQQAPFGLMAVNNARYPYGGTAGDSSTIPSEIYYRLSYRLDSEFRLEADTNYILSFDIAVNSKGLTYLYVEGLVDASATIQFGDGWLWTVDTSGYRTAHIDVPLNFSDTVEGLSSLRFTFGNRETNVVDTSIPGSTIRSKGEFYSVQVSNLKLERGHCATPWTASPRETNYLMDALQQDATFEGGLILAALIKLGYTDSNGQWKVGAGINGMLSPNASDAAKKSLILLWSGGDQIDAAVSPDDLNAATFLVRRDGSAYFCRNLIRFLEGRMEMGDNLFVDKTGLFLRDPQGSIYFKLTNQSVGDEASMLEQSVSAVNSSATMSLRIHTASSGGSGLQLSPGYYLVANAGTSLHTYSVNSGSAVSSHGATLDVSVTSSFTYGSGDVNMTSRIRIMVVVEMQSGSSWIQTASRTLVFTTDGTSHSADCALTASLQGGCRYRIRLLPSDSSLSPSAYSGTYVGASVRITGRLVSGNNCTTLQGNDGFATAWAGPTLLMARGNTIVAQVNNVGLRVIKDSTGSHLQLRNGNEYYNLDFARALSLGIITKA